jgi:hypothetical protein
MSDRFSRISDACADENFKAIYGIFAGKGVGSKGAKDGAAPLSFSDYEVDEIKRLQFESVKANYVKDGGSYRTLDDVRKEAVIDCEAAAKAFVKDGFYNPGSGFGTDIDVGNWGRPYEPLLIGPYDASAMYSSGGLSQIIIDKKSRGLVISGYEFTSGKMEGQELLELRDYAEAFGCSSIIAQAARDALLFGGSSIWAILKGDTAVTTAMSFAKLLEAKLLRKDCLDYFAEADRWNMTVIPDYDLSAKDYLNPRTFMVPISGIEVNSDRAAFVRTKPLPYWSAIRQLGWGASDITGWAKSLIGYEIMAMSLPIMCQQMSLLVHTLPLDGIIAQNGVKAAKAWQKENEREMRDWSILNPKAINSYGEISVVNRNYTGFDSLIDAIRKDIAAKTGLPESLLFYSMPNGIFNKSEDDVMLKQSETIKLIQQVVAPCVQKLIPILAISCFGCRGKADLEKYKSIKISFDTPVVSNPQKKADVALKMAQAIQLLYVTGFDKESAVNIVSKVIGEVDMPSDMSSIFAKETESKPEEMESGGDEPRNNAGVPQDTETGRRPQ